MEHARCCCCRDLLQRRLTRDTHVGASSAAPRRQPAVAAEAEADMEVAAVEEEGGEEVKCRGSIAC